jgi:hypothetical protein
VTLEGDNLTVIPRPAFGAITRLFDPASGTYDGADVTVTENKTIDGDTLPEDYRIYTDRTIPNFTVNVPDRHGNVLLVKLPESSGMRSTSPRSSGLHKSRATSSPTTPSSTAIRRASRPTAASI